MRCGYLCGQTASVHSLEVWDDLAADLLQLLIHPGADVAPALQNILLDQRLLGLHLLGGGQHGLRVLRTDHNDPVRVAHDDVPGMDQDISHRHRGVDLAGAVLIGAVGGGADGVDREVGKGANGVRIPDAAVHHNAGDPAHAAVAHHQLPEDGAAGVAPRVDDEHVSRLGQVHGLVEHQVVPLGHLDGEGGAQKGGVVHGADAVVHGRRAAHAVVNVCHREAGELLYQRPVRAVKVQNDFTAFAHNSITSVPVF